MKHAHLRHLRCTRPAYGTREHFDWSANGDSLRELEPAETMQVAPFDHATPLKVIRSIDRGEFFYSICIFSALAFVAGAVLAMGASQ